MNFDISKLRIKRTMEHKFLTAAIIILAIVLAVYLFLAGGLYLCNKIGGLMTTDMECYNPTTLRPIQPRNYETPGFNWPLGIEVNGT